MFACGRRLAQDDSSALPVHNCFVQDLPVCARAVAVIVAPVVPVVLSPAALGASAGPASAPETHPGSGNVLAPSMGFLMSCNMF